MRCDLLMVGVMVSLGGGILDGAVHAFDLVVGPRVVRLRQPVLDAMLTAESVEQAAVSVSTVWRRYGLGDGVQEICSALPVGGMRQTYDREL